MKENSTIPKRSHGIRIILYKIILVLFIILYYFKSTLDSGFGNLIENIVWFSLTAVVLLEIIKIIDFIKKIGKIEKN